MQFSPVIAGCMKWGQWGARFSRSAYLQNIQACVDFGVNWFDHADIYGSYTTEAEFGEALAENPSLRKKIGLITKCGICMVTPNRPGHQIKHYNTSAGHIINSAENSLKNFHTDYIDLFLIHRPDPLMNPDEIAEAISRLKSSGKILHFGVSNFSVSQISLLKKCMQIEVNQVEISPVHTAPFFNGVLDQCITDSIVPQAWAPLGGGKIHTDSDEEHIRRIIAMAQILAQKYQAGFDQILYAWLMKHPSGIVPLTGTTKPERIKAAYEASAISLSNEEWFMILRAAKGDEVP